jgi:hypothetical protein
MNSIGNCAAQMKFPKATRTWSLNLQAGLTGQVLDPLDELVCQLYVFYVIGNQRLVAFPETYCLEKSGQIVKKCNPFFLQILLPTTL